MYNPLRFAIIFLCACLISYIPAMAAAPACRYEVAVGPAARTLEVDAWFNPGINRELSVNRGAEPYVENATVDGKSLVKRGDSWFLPRSNGTVHVHYRFRLYDATWKINNDSANWQDGAVEANPGVYLLHPLRQPSGSAYQLHVKPAAGTAFACAANPGPDRDSYVADVSDISDGANTAFGTIQVQPLEVGGAHLLLAYPTQHLPFPQETLVAWIRAKADAVARYYKGFPIKRALLLIMFHPKGTQIEGHTEGGGGASVTLIVGRERTLESLKRNWTITHEMVHLAFPSVKRNHHWIEEGIATYVEPLARVRVGDITSEKYWGELVKGLPQGQPEAGDRGLDRTHTWGRTYWGGALFCFVADMKIRVETKNQRSLDDALRGIVQAGGNVAHDWPIERALKAGDDATGTNVLQTLYAQWATSPVTVDLKAWWQRLGISMNGGQPSFNDGAPLTQLRQSVTQSI